jgi:hypothetical protein
MSLAKQSELAIMCFGIVVLAELVLMRPYSEISEKIRSIFFSLVYILVTLVRYINNYAIDSEYNTILPTFLLILLVIALVWTWAKIISHFVSLLTQSMATQNIIVDKIFKNDVADTLDRETVAEEEQALLRKLMKRYERVELQYNFNNVRNKLLSDDD